MKKIISKPHLFFFGLIPLFLVVAFIKGDTPIDLNISYIHYLINVDFWCYISAVYFGLISLNYIALDWIKKPTKKWLSILHIILQIVSLFPYFYAIFRLDENGNLPNYSFFKIFELKGILVIGFLLFLVSIFVHLINFFASLFSNRD